MEVELYTSEQGRCSVEEYLQSLLPKTAKRIIMCLEKIEKYGFMAFKSLDTKKMKGHEFREIRIGSTRLFYVTRGGTFWLLHGFTKKSGQTPLREIRSTEAKIADLDLRIIPNMLRPKRMYEIN